MSAPQLLRSNLSDLFGSSMLPVLEELFRSAYEIHPLRREQLFKTVSHDRDIWQYSELHDMPMFSQVSEGQDYSFNAPKGGSHKTLTMQKWGLGVSFTEEVISDGKFDLVSDALAKMGKSARETMEQNAMNIFNNGFSTELCADGLSVFNAAHTTPSGTYTVRNQIASPADLSYTTLQTAITDFEKVFKGDSGIINRIQPKFLVVPSELRMYAKELVGSEKKADTNYNNINSIAGESLTVISSPHLTDTNAWFLSADPVDCGLRIISRKPLETKAAGADVGFLNDAVYFKARFREQLGCMHPNGIYGSPGST